MDANAILGNEKLLRERSRKFLKIRKETHNIRMRVGAREGSSIEMRVHYDLTRFLARNGSYPMGRAYVDKYLREFDAEKKRERLARQPKPRKTGSLNQKDKDVEGNGLSEQSKPPKEGSSKPKNWPYIPLKFRVRPLVARPLKLEKASSKSQGTP